MARETNYGARIDFILLTHGLLPWFKFGDIQPSIKGSDHCPIFVDLHDEISISEGVKTRLFESEHFENAKTSPRICAKNWPEYSREQKLLSTFFGKEKKASTTSAVSASTAPEADTLLTSTPSTTPLTPTDPPADTPAAEITPTPTPKPRSLRSELTEDEIQIISKPEAAPPLTPMSTDEPAPSQPKSGTKRKRDTQNAKPITRSSASKGKSKPQNGQASINTFFRASKEELKPSSSPKYAKTKSKSKNHSKATSISSETRSSQTEPPSSQPIDTLPLSSQHDMEDIDADLEFARKLAEEDLLNVSTLASTNGNGSGTSKEHKKSWSKFFTKHEPPKCSVHGEPCKEFVTNKPGPNRGKYFWICSRWVFLMRSQDWTMTEKLDLLDPGTMPDARSGREKMWILSIGVISSNGVASGERKLWERQIPSDLFCGVKILDVIYCIVHISKNL